jgi:hypothetical protein
VGIIENELIGVLRKAGDLLCAGLIEALLIEPDVKAARQKGGVRLELVGISRVSLANRLEIFFETQAVEAGLLEILGGADKSAGLAANRRAESAKGASSLRGEEDQGFLGFFGNDDKNAFFVDWPAPGFDAGKPGLGRRIGCAAQESHDHQIVHRLAVREIGVNPQAIPGLEIGDLGDGQSLSGALNADFHLGTDKVESGIVGISRTPESQ